MELKDGLYKVKFYSRPYINYCVVKHYGGEEKRRYMCSLDDCRQQIYEWDEDWRKEHPEDKEFVPGLKALEKKKKKQFNGYARTFEVVGINDNKVEFKGLAKEIAQKFNCTANTVTYAAARTSVFQNKFIIRTC